MTQTALLDPNPWTGLWRGAVLPVLQLGFWLLVGLLLVPSAWAAAGASPNDPIPFDPVPGSAPIGVAAGGEVWLAATFVPAATVTHLHLETVSELDTEIAVFANLAEALQDLPIAEDDNGGTGFNAALLVPLGFPSPYLVRVSARTAGTFELLGDFERIAAARCDWPAGCSLAVMAQSQPGARQILRTLHEVRDEVLSSSERGRALSRLYWRMSADLIPELIIDESFRRHLYQEVGALLPLAQQAVDAARGTGGRLGLSPAEYRRLDELFRTLSPRLTPNLAGELRAQWDELALRQRVGQPLGDILVESGLLSSVPQRQTVIVKLRVEPTETAGGLHIGHADLDARLAAVGVQSIRRLHEASGLRRAAGLTRTIVVEVASPTSARELVSELEDHPLVEWAQLSARLWALSPGTDPYREDLWGLDAIRAPQTWSATAGSCTTPVAVVDTGLRSGIADLGARTLDQLGYDFVDDDPDPEDGHGHGTHVAGTIASELGNSVSIAGVAPEICVFGVKVLDDDGSGSAEGVAAGIVHAVDAGAKVINLSLGCDCETQQVIEEALGYAASRDVVVVAAAGNDGADELNYPASSSRTIAVGALDSDLELASFSSHGVGLDLTAPGVDIVSVFRDGESCTGSGTSMAAPHVSGVAALMRSANPSVSRDEVRTLLRREARDLGPPGYDTRFGAGLVDAVTSVGAVGGGVTPGECTSTNTAICLQGGRFRVEASWRRPNGSTGPGRAVRLTPDTSYFWFFSPSNVEVVVKVLDACRTGSPRFWVFAGGLTNVEVLLRVTDTATGEVGEYFNPMRTAFQPIQDTEAFATCDAISGAVGSQPAQQGLWAAPVTADIAELLVPLALKPQASLAAATGTCSDGDTSICLQDGRFRVEATWFRPDGSTGQGRSVRLTPDTGYFWFFNHSNVEMVVKVLNACGTGRPRFWVFAGGLTNVEVLLRITDTITGEVAEYLNPMRTAFQPIQDTGAFATCP